MTKQQAIALLKKIKEMSEEMSLTRQFTDGSETNKLMYKKIRNFAIENEWVDADLVIDLDEALKPDIEHSDVIMAAATLFLGLLEMDGY